MRIERLELYGYKRLMLNNINLFVYTPTALHQLILGTNGSGKSSILFELSPLPAHSSNYTKEGYKDITLTHKGSTYRLISTFKNGKHSFKKDEEELNPGGTQDVQRKLVEQHLGYTKELHELLIGKRKFTLMAPIERRKWITALSSNDYTWPLALFKKLSSSARDSQGASKHLKARLGQETQNLRALSDMDGLEERASQLHQELNLLLSARVPNLPAYERLVERVDMLLQQVEQHSTNVVKLQTAMPKGRRYKRLSDVSDDVSRTESEVASTQTLLDRFTTEYSELELMLNELHADANLTPENIENHIFELENEIGLRKPNLQLFKDLTEPREIQRDSQQVLDEVIELFKLLPDNSDRRYSRETLQQAKDRIAVHRANIDKGTAKLAALQAKISHIQSARDTQCPKCLYVWREGFSEKELNQLEEWVSEHTKIVEAEQAAIVREEKFIEESEHYAGLYVRFRGFVSSYPRMRPLWDYVLENKLLTDRPNEQIHVLFTWQKDVDLSCEIDAYQRKLTHVMEVSEKQQQLGEQVHFTQRMMKLHDEIEATTGRLQSLKAESKDIRTYRDRLLKLEDGVAALERTLRELHQLQSQLTDGLRNRHIDEVVRQHQTDLAMIQRQLTEKATLEGIVRDLESSHREVEMDYQVLDMLATALSPTEGLIAEQLTGFISVLTAQLNSIIASVWTYDMLVLPCGLDSGELDYKFPLQVRTADNISRDIDEGSTAQQEIINFAFQLTVMLYMELSDYPLYLDEPGPGFDEQHRANMMGFIKQLMDSGQHSQLFMISHYASNHGAFTSAQVLVLDSSNIAIPGDHNQHVVMA